MSILEFFSISRTLGLIVWALSVLFFYSEFNNKRRAEFYKDLKGPDGVWQPLEIAAWKWVNMSPILTFLTLFLAIVNLKMEDYWVNLVMVVWAALNTVFSIAIAGKSWGNSPENKSLKENKDEAP